MNYDMTDNELRVLGCLIEKERTTPDNYPLSTNALTSACNQKTSRDPVMALNQADIDAAMLLLRDRGLARSLRPTGSRAWKHRHVTTEVIPLSDEEISLLAVLMLRGAQTAGELRTRTERMVGFESADDVDAALRALADRDEPLTANIGRGPGQSQDRWVHCLSGPVDTTQPSHQIAQAATTSRAPERSTTNPADLARRAEFRALHEQCFVMPNPWDRGSAKVLEEMGFRALATTSAGHGRAIGKDDQLVTRDELVPHVADLTEFIGVPLNVDSERLFPDDPGGIAETVRLLAAAGASGCSIEDYQPDDGTIDPIDRAAAAVAEAAEACNIYGIVLTARAENQLYELGDIDDTIARLQAYESAGADVVYAPGYTNAADIGRIVGSVRVPVNVLRFPDGPGVDELAALGVARISIGSAFYNASIAALRHAAVAVQLTDGDT